MKVKLVYNMPIGLFASAITLYPFILFRDPIEKVPERLLRHEMIHVAQVRRAGFIGFYVSYILYWLAGIFRYGSHWEAYREIPYEVEAYRNELRDFTYDERQEVASYFETRKKKK